MVLCNNVNSRSESWGGTGNPRRALQESDEGMANEVRVLNEIFFFMSSGS